jgi:hypothetical protein
LPRTPSCESNTAHSYPPCPSLPACWVSQLRLQTIRVSHPHTYPATAPAEPAPQETWAHWSTS